MRVTAEVKARTEGAILKAAAELFADSGYARASTRGIARRAGVATGTVFNYFPSKEAIARALVDEALVRARLQFEKEVEPGSRSVAEELFALGACALREIEARFEVLEGALPALLDPTLPAPLEDAVATLLRARGRDADDPVSLALHRSLLVGVLAFRLRDASPGAEDSLALLDRSTRAFEQALNRGDS